MRGGNCHRIGLWPLHENLQHFSSRKPVGRDKARDKTVKNGPHFVVAHRIARGARALDHDDPFDKIRGGGIDVGANASLRPLHRIVDHRAEPHRAFEREVTHFGVTKGICEQKRRGRDCPVPELVRIVNNETEITKTDFGCRPFYQVVHRVDLARAVFEQCACNAPG